MEDSGAAASVRVERSAGGAGAGAVVPVTVRVAGPLTLTTTAPLWGALDSVVREIGDGAGSAVLDVSGVPACDTAGATYLATLRKRAGGEKGPAPPLVGAREQVASIVTLVETARLAPAAPAAGADSDDSGLFRFVGQRTIDVYDAGRAALTYIGDLVTGLAAAVRRPSGIRARDCLLTMQRTGADAVWIVALINFLMGVILAFQGVSMLGDLGFESYTPSAVSVGILLELGPLMTAVIVSGRSGSAFAAEIGTMKVNEEVDALETMGLDRTRFLVVPKVVALFLMMPLLVVFADACGLIGGLAICGTVLGMPVTQYFTEAFRHVDLWGASQGLIKGQAYALCIAGVGCYRGLRTELGAQGVGLSTTSAVVSSILLVIISDAVLTVIFRYVHP